MAFCMNTQNTPNIQYETQKEHKERIRSHRIIYFTQFNIIFSYSMVLVGLWPYIHKLEPTVEKSFLGLLIGVSALGLTIISPILGWCYNKLKSSRLLFIICMVITIISYIIHASLESIKTHRKFWFILSRFLAGVASGCVSLCRSHISTTTLIDERRKAISHLSMWTILATCLGPGLQSVIVTVGEGGFWIIPNYLKIDMYTLVAWIIILMAVINLILFLPFFFNEHNMLIKEDQVARKLTYKSNNYKLLAWCFIFMNFIITFNITFMKVLGTPIAMEEFKMKKAEAITLNSLLSLGIGIVSFVTIMSIDTLCQRFSEMRMLVTGNLLIIIGRFCYIPIGSEKLDVYDDLMYINSICMNYDNCTEHLGCPLSQKWCDSERKLSFAQFIIGNIIENIGHSIAITLTIAIFSKVLGSKQQGTWMGLITSIGSIARITSPIFITVLYTYYGPTIAALITNFICLSVMIALHLTIDCVIIKEEKTANGPVEDIDLLHQNTVEFKNDS